MIFYLIYISSANHLYSDADLTDILSKSRLNNKRLNVTGMLLYHEGNILQVLEGEEETVIHLYTKIKQDSRHSNVIKMVGGTSDERNFPDWSMGFKTLTSDEWKAYSGYLKLDPATIVNKLKNSNLKIDTVVKSFIAVTVR